MTTQVVTFSVGCASRLFRRAWRWRCAIFATGAAAAALAENASSGFVERSWLVDDGLPHNVVNRIVQDEAGFVWLATGAGLTRFDGRNFKPLSLPMRSAGMGLNIRDLALEGPASLLLLPASGGLVRYRAGSFSEHPAAAAVAGKSLVDLFVEPGGAVWLGSEDETVVRWDEGGAVAFGPKEGLNRRGNRFSFALDGAGRTWIAGGDFVGVYRAGRLEPLPEPVGGSVIIAAARSGGVWLSTFEHLSKWENGQVTTVLDPPVWPVARSSVQYLFEDRSGVLWIATRRDGLFALAGRKIIAVPTSSPLIRSVGEDREGNVWVSTDGGGIDRLRPKAFVLLDGAAGLKQDVSTSMCADAHGAIWCANQNGGLVRCANGEVETIARSPVGAEFFAISVCPDRDDHIWVGMTGGLYRVAATAPHSMEKMSPMLSPARLLFCDHAGDLWVGSGDGELGYFRAGAYQQVVANTNSPDKRIVGLAEAPGGGIWAATRGGELMEYAAGRLTVHTESPLVAQIKQINALHIDQSGGVWLGTPDGLALLRGRDLRILTKADGLPDDYIDQIAEDNEDRLWLGSRSGLFHVSIPALVARAGGRGPLVVGKTFGRDEGLAGTTSMSGEGPSTWKTADGRLWFATHRGVIGLDPAMLSLERTPPPVFIDEIRVDGRGAAPPIILIPPGNHRVDFRFVALNFSAPEKVRVRHQLIGIDLDWVETSSEHTATYARLPAGTYDMRVMACNQDGVWSEHRALATIIVRAAWWQTWWCAAAALLAFTGLVAWSVRFWSHRRLKNRLEQLERENAVERERARIARDLHDELGGSLTQIRLLAERIKRHANQPEFKSFAGQLAWRARRLGGELESIIWTVSPRNTTWDRLASFIAHYSLKFFRDTGITCVMHGVDQVPARPLRPEEQHNLLAVTKEALNNILKHSQATQATLTISVEAGWFTYRIHDDGVGFDPERRDWAACNGLSNMRARLHEIGGEIHIDSAPGQGTTILVRHFMDANSRPASHDSPPVAAPAPPPSHAHHRSHH